MPTGTSRLSAQLGTGGVVCVDGLPVITPLASERCDIMHFTDISRWQERSAYVNRALTLWTPRTAHPLVVVPTCSEKEREHIFWKDG